MSSITPGLQVVVRWPGRSSLVLAQGLCVAGLAHTGLSSMADPPTGLLSGSALDQFSLRQGFRENAFGAGAVV